MLAKVAALVSVATLALSIGGIGTVDGPTAHSGGEGWEGLSLTLCAAGVAVLCASFSVDFYQIWVVVPREAAAAAPSKKSILATKYSKLDRGNRNGGVEGSPAMEAPAAVVHRRSASVEEVGRPV